jgi:fused signal recognition particle receptor
MDTPDIPPPPADEPHADGAEGLLAGAHEAARVALDALEHAVHAAFGAASAARAEAAAALAQAHAAQSAREAAQAELHDLQGRIAHARDELARTEGRVDAQRARLVGMGEQARELLLAMDRFAAGRALLEEVRQEAPPPGPPERPDRGDGPAPSAEPGGAG